MRARVVLSKAMTDKKVKFIRELSSYGCAVLVGPMLTQEEYELIPSDGPLLMVDGGADSLNKFDFKGCTSHFKVGDGDSATHDMDVKLPPKKDYSDLAYALTLLPKEIKKIKLFGFLGGRKDHELINFGEAHQYLLGKKTKTFLIFSEEFLFLSEGKWSLDGKGSSFSLMALDKPRVSLRGKVEYEIEDMTPVEPLSSKFLSNYAHGDFELSCTSPVFLYGEGLRVKDL